MTTHVRCGTLFAGDETAPGAMPRSASATTARSPSSAIPPRRRRSAVHDTVLDYSGLFVMPGLLDVHTHLAYGNAKSEEDIDLYQPMEFRALRALFFAQKVVAAGYTSICAPGDAGQISLSVRNAINFGLFDGPRVTAAGRYLTTRQGLTDWYPTWIGVPDTSIGRLVTNKDEAIEEIRVQVKNGVDCIKIAMDGMQTRDDGSLVAAFNQDETTTMVTEAHRLGKRVVVHAMGREAVLYSARAGVDLIFHAYPPRRRMHRRDAEIRQRDRPDNDLPAQHHRLHPAARAGRRSGAGPSARRARIRHRLREPAQGAQRPACR